MEQLPEPPTVALFRPDDDRLRGSAERLREAGFEPLEDPLLEVESTGRRPRDDADVYVFTSVTAAELVDEEPEGLVAAVGPKTAEALRERGIEVDVVPEEYTSGGLVDALAGTVDGVRVEVARSSHGSDVLLEGLDDAGGYVHETVLYRLEKPRDGGVKTAEAVEEGGLDAALFTSSLTVEHLLTEVDADSLEEVVVGAIGAPTRETAESYGVDVDYVADDETFESLVKGLQWHLAPE